MKSLIPLIALLLIVAFAATSEAACGKRLGKARQRAGAVARFLLPPYGK